MITLLESFLPKWLIEVIVLGLLALGVMLYFEHKGAADELGKLQKSSATLIGKVVALNYADTASYQAAVTVDQEKTNAVLAANSALQSQLADSVRGFDAYRRAHRAVASAPSAAGAAGSGECGLEDCGAVVERLAERGDVLAGGLGAVSADLQGCQRDRDALTGEPK